MRRYSPLPPVLHSSGSNFLMTPSGPAIAPNGARRSVGLAANLALRIASAFIRCRYEPGTSPSNALTRTRGRRACA